MILVDSHVHIHNSFNIEMFLDSTFENISNNARNHNIKKDFIGILCLSEIYGVNIFNKIKSKIIEPDSLLENSNYIVNKTEEDDSVIVINAKGEKLILISGKQIIAEDGIEVLALGTNINFENGKKISELINEINKNDAIPVLPWGVGKWLGKRKKIITNFILNSNENFFLGDNSGRPTFWVEPNVFELGRSKKHFVLPGTDALSLNSEIKKTGSFGFVLNSKIDLQKPSNSLKEILLNLKNQPEYFGQLENPIKFIKNQISIQIKKHFIKN